MDPWKDLEVVRQEVANFSRQLLERPHLVAVNKLDLAATRRLRSRTRRAGVQFVSALTGEGVADLMHAITKLVASAPQPPVGAPAKVTKLNVRQADDLVVERKSYGYVVSGERVERLVERTNLATDRGLSRFQSDLDRLGVNSALEAAGVKPGDTVTISGVEFEYQP